MQQSTYNQTGGTNVNNITKTYSSLANVPKHKRAKLISEAKSLIGGARKCKEMWREIRKADFRKEGILNETNIRLLFEKCGAYIYDLLRLSSPAEIIAVFDTGSDCQLNEDEQVLIFQVIREKMSLFANECCKIHEYSLYKDLMREMRLLESEICKNQNELRECIQHQQMTEYNSIGQDQLKDFYKQWDENFRKFGDTCLEKVHALQHDHEDQMEQLNLKLDRAIEASKIKPDIALKDMQNAEKLVAVNERIEEAQNYRNELKKFEVVEAERVEAMKAQNSDKQRKALLKGQKKEMDMLELKIETGRNNLKIQMDQELVVLQKQITLHVSDIERMQGFVKKLALEKGEVRDELMRAKARSRATMEQLKQQKKIQEPVEGKGQQSNTMAEKMANTTSVPFAQGSPVDILLFGGRGKDKGLTNTFSSQNSENQSSSQQTINGLRNIIKVCDITRFNISTVGPDGAKLYTVANAKNAGGYSKMPIDASMQTKIQVLLDQRKPPTEALPSLVDMYDEELNAFD